MRGETRRVRAPAGRGRHELHPGRARGRRLEHTLGNGGGPFCELKSTDGKIDLFSHGTVKATIPAGDYQMIVSVSPGKTVDATITPILRKLN